MRVILLCISLCVCGCVCAWVCAWPAWPNKRQFFINLVRPPVLSAPNFRRPITSLPLPLPLPLILPLALFAICACHFTVAFNLFLSKYTLNLTLCCAAIKMLFALLSLLIRPVCLWRCRRPKDTNCWLVIIMTSFLLLSRDARKYRQYVYTCIYICIAPSRSLSFFGKWRKVSKQINSSSRFSQWLKHCGACMNCFEFCSALLHFSFLSASPSLTLLSRWLWRS